mmetsp:Transcript_18206/g.64541  ORF Transcript_18206/g.64541 Transcript_18206/m.64541 type:complete len:349 (+) Transcript_18206:780-1826(+)
MHIHARTRAPSTLPPAAAQPRCRCLCERVVRVGEVAARAAHGRHQRPQVDDVAEPLADDLDPHARLADLGVGREGLLFNAAPVGEHHGHVERCEAHDEVEEPRGGVDGRGRGLRWSLAVAGRSAPTLALLALCRRRWRHGWRLHLDVAACLVVVVLARSEEVEARPCRSEGCPAERQRSDDDAEDDAAAVHQVHRRVAVAVGVAGDGRVGEVDGVREHDGRREQPLAEGRRHGHAHVHHAHQHRLADEERVQAARRELAVHEAYADARCDEEAEGERDVGDSPAVAEHGGLIALCLEPRVVLAGPQQQELVQVIGEVDDDEQLQQQEEHAADARHICVAFKELIGDEE